jgi:LmbE family N-acetylglucosaminyl deacetylase
LHGSIIAPAASASQQQTRSGKALQNRWGKRKSARKNHLIRGHADKNPMVNPHPNHPGTAMPPWLAGSDYAVVVAHPDDEVLWFSSVLADARQVILCYGDYAPRPSIGPARRRVVRDFPHPHVVFLDLPEGVFHECADWSNPVPVPAGIAIPDVQVRRRYEDNFALLVSRMEPLLRDVDFVFTHNPWGEYGHEDHVQIHQAVRAVLSSQHGRKRARIIVPSWSAPKSSKMMEKTAHCASPEQFTMPVDKARALALKQLYKRHGCWTWLKDWLPPDEDTFLLPGDDNSI